MVDHSDFIPFEQETLARRIVIRASVAGMVLTPVLAIGQQILTATH